MQKSTQVNGYSNLLWLLIARQAKYTSREVFFSCQQASLLVCLLSIISGSLAPSPTTQASDQPAASTLQYPEGRLLFSVVVTKREWQRPHCAHTM